LYNASPRSGTRLSAILFEQHDRFQEYPMNDAMQSTLATDETVQLISSQKVDGTAVYDASGDKLGNVDHVMINKRSGQVVYAVMSFGGFLGIGESYHPLPWEVLDYDTRLGGYRVDVGRDRLQGAPYYTSRTQPDWSPGYTGSIDDYWLARG
jgi:PRC-barrel domain